MAGRALSFSFLLLFFFFPVAIGSFGSSPFLLPLVAASPPAPSLPHWCTLFVEGGGGVAEGDVLFSPEAQREGETSTLEGKRINT